MTSRATTLEARRPGPAAGAHLERALRWLVPALVVCAFFSVSLMQIAGGLAALAWLGARASTGLRARDLPLAAPAAALALVMLASALLARDPLRALKESTEALLPLALWASLAAARTPLGTNRLVATLALTVAFAAIAGIAQGAVEGPEFRVRGNFSTYMTYAGVVLMGSLVVLAHWTLLPKELRHLGLLAVAGLAAVALALTQTRSAWLGLAAGAILVQGLWSRRSLLVLPLLATGGYFLSPEPVQERALSFLDLEDITATERIFMWRAGLDLWADHAVLGVGPGHLRELYPSYKLEGDPWLPERRFTHLHSNPLQIAAELGALGLAAWLWLWIAWARLLVRLWRAIDPRDRPARALVAGSAAALVGFHVMGLFEYTWGNSEVVTLAFAIMALPLALREYDGPRRDDPRAAAGHGSGG